jgi:hypothetical protein
MTTSMTVINGVPVRITIPAEVAGTDTMLGSGIIGNGGGEIGLSLKMPRP